MMRFIDFANSVFLGLCITYVYSQEYVVANIPGVGVLRGKQLKTVGNLNREQKIFYTFRNIPFGFNVSDENRFRQATKFEGILGSTSDPYDATVHGPMCIQTSVNPESLEEQNNTPFPEYLSGFVEDGMKALGKEENRNLYNTTFDSLLITMETLLSEDLSSMTRSEYNNKVLDIDKSVSEECLQLTVNTPLNLTNGPERSDLPVLVFIHGGAFMGGDQYQFDNSRFGDVKDMVVVAINYRVGPLGFMCLDTDEAAGNMGLLDQILALEWVQDHIHKFGGDPNKVTVSGESAGSASVGHLLLTPLTDNLFAHAIGESGGALNPWSFDPIPEYHTRNLAKFLFCEREDLDEMVQCFRRHEATAIQQAFVAYSAAERLKGHLGFGGSIPCGQSKGERKVYEQFARPEEILATGNFFYRPIMFGGNANEGIYVHGLVYFNYLYPNGYVNDTEFLTNDLISEVMRTIYVDQGYSFRPYIEDYYFQNELGNLETMTPGIIDASSYFTIEETYQYQPSYWYSVEHESEKKSYFYAIYGTSRAPFLETHGVCHADELLYIYYRKEPLVYCDTNAIVTDIVHLLENDCNMDPECVSKVDGDFVQEWGHCILAELNEEEQVWSDKMVRVWSDFVEHGNPTPSSSADIPVLPTWTREEPKYLAFRKEGVYLAEDYTLTYSSFERQENATTIQPTTPSTSTITRFDATTTTLSLLFMTIVSTMGFEH